jgi:hypothetical protein
MTSLNFNNVLCILYVGKSLLYPKSQKKKSPPKRTLLFINSIFPCKIKVFP